MSDSNKRRYEKRKAEGICVICGENKAAEGRARCTECLVKLRQYNKGLRDRRINSRCCAHCGRKLNDSWYYVLCPSCREGQNRRQNDYIAKRKAKRTGAGTSAGV